MELVRELLPENLWKAMVRQLGREEVLRLLWPALVGSRLASQTRLRQLRGATLLVSVPDPQWTRSLQPLEKMILDAKPKTIGGLKVTGLDTTDGFKFNLEDGGWLLIRFSGTEPKMRVYCETMHEDKVQAILQDGLRTAGLK